MGKVLAIKTDELFPEGIKEGFFRIKKEDRIFQIIKEKALFLERSKLEDDEAYQQLIPQIVLKVRNKIFIHRIAQKGNESRLHDLYPIFLGGHVDEGDVSIEEAADREFNEEIDYKGKIITKEFQGLVKLHDNDVDRVHTGLVWVYEGEGLSWKHRKEECLTDGKFVLIRELGKYERKMTFWSKIFLPELRKMVD